MRIDTTYSAKKKKKKDKMPHQNCTIDEQCEALYEQWQNTIAA